ncbi:MAG: 4-hydroxybenzoate octaprenyltransferase [Wenzhouxiangellaceae bacterium]|nr:4-hydroxybenzoate octaprenyltransferase [Wenzhouxiangellaceae bacterium]
MEFKLSARIFQGPLGPWLRLMRFDRPIGIALLLWPTWWGLFMAGSGRPGLKNLLIFTLGVVVMRAAGCVINDFADRELDSHVARTRARPLACGELQPRQALALFFVLLGLALALVLLTNTLTLMLALVGALLAGSYPFFKRFTHLPQIALGVAFAWAIPMAFAAETGQLPEPAWWLFAINIIWVLIYDTEYAMADREEDLEAGVKSTAILFGRYDIPVLAVLMGLMTAALLLFGLRFVPQPAWFAAVVITFGLFQVQLWRIRNRDPQACFKAFLSNHWVGLTIFAGLLASLLQIQPR